MSLTVKENEVLRAENISFKYVSASKPILKDLNFRLLRSELTFLVGPGGVGKTTLLKILGGLLNSQQGNLWIQGAPLKQISQREKRIVLSRLAMTFQRSGLFDSMSVLENLLFPLRELTELSEKESLVAAQRALEQVRIIDSETKFPHQISGGMQKRLGIARALVLQPEVILYDDPTAGLDPITSSHIMDLILELHREKNTASLIATNDLDLAFKVSHKMGAKIAFLFDGTILEIATAEELLSSKHPVIYQFVRGLLDGPLSPMESM